MIPKSKSTPLTDVDYYQGVPPYNPAKNTKLRQGDDILSKKQSNKKVISLRLTEEENQKLKYCADLCGLSQNEFIRQLCKGQTPKAKPTREFWEMLDTLYSVHKGFKECAEFEPSALTTSKEIECLILDLQEVG